MAENNEQIRVLSNKEQARDKINVWHGSSSNWINMIKELTGNSLDIFDNNKLNHIQIIIHNNNKIEYIDDANGIPVEGTASNGQPNYEAIFEVPFAGSKYNEDRSPLPTVFRLMPALDSSFNAAPLKVSKNKRLVAS
jgi:DNA gyrase subunit B